MTERALIEQRLRNQKLTRTTYRRPEEVVAWLGAVQAQDYIGAKWALGLRAIGLTDADVDRAFDEGRLLRTHVLRPTWHFVAPADIRWMLTLTAPRVHGFSAYYYRKNELEPKVFARCHKTLTRALEGGRHRTRAELQTALRDARIVCDNLRTGLILMHAELSGLICSGARRGKQQTYALLDERVPPSSRTPSRAEALAELARRYIASRGPVTVRDFSWWSGLSTQDAKIGVESIASELERHSLQDGANAWWSLASQRQPRSQSTSKMPQATPKSTSPRAWLLPNYDEYFIAYKDREIVLGDAPTLPLANGDPRSSAFAHLLAIDGRLAGTWKRTPAARGAAGVELKTFRSLTKPERAAVDEAIARYGAFMGAPVTLAVV